MDRRPALCSVEPVRDLRNDLDTGIASQRLNPRNVSEVQAGFLGQGLVRRLALAAQSLDVGRERLQWLRPPEPWARQRA